MKFFVYILFSKKFDTFYIGQTNNVEERYNRHNKGYEKATKRYIPWKLIGYIEKESRIEAVALEIKLKNLSKLRIESFIKKYINGGSDEL